MRTRVQLGHKNLVSPDVQFGFLQAPALCSTFHFAADLFA